MRKKIIGPDYKSLKKEHVSENILDNEDFIRNLLSKNADLRFKKLSCKQGHVNEKMLIVYIHGMVNKEVIQEFVLKPIMSISQGDSKLSEITIENLRDNIFSILEIDEANSFDILILSLLSGNTLLFLDKSDTALIIKNENIKERSIGAAESEQTIGGMRIAFTETIKSNISLIRSQIKDPNLCVEVLNLGKRTKREVAVVYIEGVINNKFPGAIIDKIQKVDIDGIISSGQLEQLIEKNKWTVLPQMLSTERVDRVVGDLLEGRAAVIIDGMPFALIIPSTFKIFLSSPDDYFQRPVVVSTMLRLIRYLSFIVSTSFEPIYLALTVYQPGMIPTPLALSITGSRVGLPFPMVIEIYLMETTLYTIQEAAIRLPKPMGTTVGVVGGLVIGQSVVQAGIVSPIIVIIVAGSAISSFAIPSYTFSLGCTLIRVFLLGMASIFGLYGVVIGWILITIHIASLENFGIRYLSDYSPYSITNLKDSIIRISESIITKRAENLELEDNIKNDSKTEDTDNA